MKYDGLGLDNKFLRADVLREFRIARRETQTKFWRRFGVTQSRGSRFELGTEIPPSVAILIKLYFEGTVSDGDLWRARRSSPGLKLTAHASEASI